jgi:hypothetical protein
VLNGDKSTAPSGSITSYAWTKVSGPDKYEMLTPGLSSTWIRHMDPGTYVFRLTITDNLGATSTDEVVITVTAGNNGLPVARAGNDITVLLPVNSVTLNGSTSGDADGNIVSYKWTYVSGPGAYVISNPNAVSTTVTGLVAGTYVFRLSVTDNHGALSSDEITVNVAASTAVLLPVADAWKDETIPAGQATVLRGNRSIAPAGYITNYSWTKISGPAAYEMLSPDADTSWIRNMTQGIYAFRLTIKDNKGNTASDEVVITVTGSNLPRAPVSNGITADAGKDETIPVGQATVLRGINNSSSSGQVIKYSWEKIAGPSQFEMLTPSGETTWIRNMVQGSYTYKLTITDNTGATASDEVLITVTAPTAMNRATPGTLDEQPVYPFHEEPDVLQIFPNPVNNVAGIKWSGNFLGSATIKIFDATDVAVSSITVKKDQYQYQSNVELGSLKPGMYILEVKMQNGKSLTEKFIKQ